MFSNIIEQTNLTYSDNNIVYLLLNICIKVQFIVSKHNILL